MNCAISKAPYNTINRQRAHPRQDTKGVRGLAMIRRKRPPSPVVPDKARNVRTGVPRAASHHRNPSVVETKHSLTSTKANVVQIWMKRIASAGLDEKGSGAWYSRPQ